MGLFSGSLFSVGLIIGGNFEQLTLTVLGLYSKGLLSEGYLRLIFGGLIFGKA